MSWLGDLLNFRFNWRKDQREERANEREDEVAKRAGRRELIELLDHQITNAEKAIDLAADPTERQLLITAARRYRAFKDAALQEQIKDHLAVTGLGEIASDATTTPPPLNAPAPSVENQRPRISEEADHERRHAKVLRETHAAAEESLRAQVESAERQAGVDSSGDVQATAELPEEVRNNLSQILSLLREMKASRQQVQVFEPLSPEHIAEEHLSQGNAFYTAGDFHTALSEYERALELQPQNATLLMNRGAVLGNLGRDDEALEAYDRALALRPDHPGTLNNRGSALVNLGRYDEALNDLSQALALRPDHADTLTNYGTTLAYLDRYDEALQTYDRSLTLRPDHADTLMARGTTLRILRRNEEALQAYDQALALRPGHADTLMNRGVALHSLGRYHDALQSYDEAFHLRPDHAGTFYNRACLYSLWGKPDAALQDLRRAIEGNPENRQEASVDSDFDNIRNDLRFLDLFPVVSISSSRCGPGEITKVDITAKDSVVGIGAWSIDVSYDQALLSASGCVARSGGVCNAAFSQNTVRFTGASAEGQRSEFLLGTIEFQAGAVIGIAALVISVQVLADATMGAPRDIKAGLIIQNGTVTIESLRRRT